LRGLNLSISKHISRAIDQDPFADLSLFRNEYNTHLDDIRTKFQDVIQREKQFLDQSNNAPSSSQTVSALPSPPSTEATKSTAAATTQPEDQAKHKEFLKSSPIKKTSLFDFGSSKSDLSGASPAFKPSNPFGSTTSFATSFSAGAFGGGNNKNFAPSLIGGLPAATTDKQPFFIDSAAAAAANTGKVGFGNAAAFAQDEDKGEPEDTPPKAEPTPLQVGVGEEDEDTIHAVRSKIYRFVDAAFVDTGVGELRLNRKKDNSAVSRLLCHLDGSGRLLLNARVYKGMPLDVVGNKKRDVQVLVSIDGQMTRFLLRVKDADAATELVEKLKSLIADCQ
jgi:hypothetical protein